MQLMLTNRIQPNVDDRKDSIGAHDVVDRIKRLRVTTMRCKWEPLPLELATWPIEKDEAQGLWTKCLHPDCRQKKGCKPTQKCSKSHAWRFLRLRDHVRAVHPLFPAGIQASPVQPSAVHLSQWMLGLCRCGCCYATGR